MFLSYQPLVMDRQVGNTFGKTIDKVSLQHSPFKMKRQNLSVLIRQ